MMMQQSMSLSFVVVVADATVDALKHRWQKVTIIETETDTEIETEIQTEIQTEIETESDLYGWFFTPNDAPHL